MVAAVFAPFVSIAAGLGDHVKLLLEVCYWLVRRPFRPRIFLDAMYFVGVGSLPIIVLVGTFTGAVTALQSVSALRLFQAENFAGSGVALALSREMGPVLTALMLVGRAGSGMATELGSMRITEQIDALTTMAVNPIQYLVVPRVVAGLLMAPLMTFLFDAVGMLGGYAVAVWVENVDPGRFMENVRWFTDPDDIFQGLFKAVVFGVVFTLIGCYQGFYVSPAAGAKGVGLATTRAVVAGSVAVIALDYFLSDMLIAVLGGGM